MRKALPLLILALASVASAQNTCSSNILSNSTGFVGLCSQFTTSPYGPLIYPPRNLYYVDAQDGTLTNGYGSLSINGLQADQVNLYLPSNPCAQYFGGSTTLSQLGTVTAFKQTGTIPVYPSTTPTTITYTYAVNFGTQTIYGNAGTFDVAWTGTFEAVYKFTGTYDNISAGGRGGHSIRVPLFELQESSGEVDGIPRLVQ